MRPRGPGGDGLELFGVPRSSWGPGGGGADRVAKRPTPPVPLWRGGDDSSDRYVLDVEPLFSLDVGGAPDPDGAVPLGAPEPLLLPMLGQFLVEPEFALDAELALDPELAPELPLLAARGGCRA